MTKHLALLTVVCLGTGCAAAAMAKVSSGQQSLTRVEEAYPISKNEPSSECKMVGGFFGYETPCGSNWGSVTDDVQFSCIRKEITKAGGNCGVLDAVVGAGWYKGRIYKCPEAIGSVPVAEAKVEVPATDAPSATVCDESKTYDERIVTTEGPARSALEKIARRKHEECDRWKILQSGNSHSVKAP